MIDRIIDRYSSAVVSRPVTTFVVILVVTGILAAGSTRVETVEQNTEDFLPDTFDSIKAFNTIEAEFGSAEATTYTILIEAEPRYGNSNEIRDMREPELLRYTQLIKSEVSGLDRVTGAEAPSDLFTDIPSSKANVVEAMETLGKDRWSRYISEDYSAAKIEIRASSISADEEVELAKDIRYQVESNPKPPGVELTYTGQTYIDEAFQNQSNRTNQVTTLVAFSLVLVIVILLFRSIYYGLTSLQTLVFGIAAGFGLFGYLGFNLSPATSGAISIGIGIAIDFGIQPVARYREERKTSGMEEALSTTIKGVSRPMTLGVIAAIMGFSTLSLGRITFLSSLGVLLSLTTLLAYVAAFTVIPTTLIIHDRYISGKIPDLKKYYMVVK